ncbi:ProQ/FinO family protein [Acidithiobacillus ferrooxidans]|uniref:ProQ/FinO family protein n=1 Tax=Acidithiobacillus ferrooxidans TaxID=920 RepID=UPI00214BE97B|nr:ProQ/FinO family protein [Acidithiobacillus ferrooxidans]MCR2831337.1 ProQ/FinO family protein [Acidithiobacillus ferrooxidans]
MNSVSSTKNPATGRKRRKKIRQSTVDDQPAIRELAARFPLFSAPSPMKLGVNAELQQFCRAAIPEELMSRTRVRLAVNYFLSRWARQPEYRAALSAGGPRYDLWMKPCGGVLDEELDARKFLKKRGRTQHAIFP